MRPKLRPFNNYSLAHVRLAFFAVRWGSVRVESTGRGLKFKSYTSKLNLSAGGDPYPETYNVSSLGTVCRFAFCLGCSHGLRRGLVNAGPVYACLHARSNSFKSKHSCRRKRRYLYRYGNAGEWIYRQREPFMHGHRYGSASDLLFQDVSRSD